MDQKPGPPVVRFGALAVTPRGLYRRSGIGNLGLRFPHPAPKVIFYSWKVYRRVAAGVKRSQRSLALHDYVTDRPSSSLALLDATDDAADNLNSSRSVLLLFQIWKMQNSNGLALVVNPGP